MKFVEKIKAPMPAADRILNNAEALMFVILLILTAVLYNVSPSVVPTHFSLSGIAVKWAGKMFFWNMAIEFAVIIIALYVSAYFCNLSYRPIDYNSERQRPYALSARLIRIINLDIALLWLFKIITSSSGILGIPAEATSAMFITWLILLIIPVIYYLFRIITASLRLIK